MENETQSKGQPDYRKQAREQLKGNIGKPMLFTLLYGTIGAIIYLIIFFIFKIDSSLSITISSVLISPLILSSIIFYVKFSKNEEINIGNIWSGYKILLPSLALYLISNIPNLIQQLISLINPKMGDTMYSIITLIGCIITLLISLTYTMSYYIVADEKNVKIKEILIKSKQIMKGHKRELFLLQLSFIGWGFVAIVTLGIALLWVVPYVNLTLANFFLNIKQKYIQQSVISEEGIQS